MWQWSQWQYCLGRHVPLMKSSWPFRSCDNKNRENVTLVFKCRSSLTRARIFQQLNYDKLHCILVGSVQPADWFSIIVRKIFDVQVIRSFSGTGDPVKTSKNCLEIWNEEFLWYLPCYESWFLSFKLYDIRVGP